MKTVTIVIAVLVSTLAMGVHPAPTSSSSPLARAERQGVVSGVRLDMDGSIYLRLAPSPALDASSAGETDPEGGTWFRIPPDRSDVISVEEMLLALVLDTEPDETLTLTYKVDRMSDGKTPENAPPILHVQRP